MPSFDGATGWLNSRSLASAGLRGKVVLINFWTYTPNNGSTSSSGSPAQNDRTFEITFLDPGVQVCAFRFG